MARTQTLYVCRSCGGEAVKWQGQCTHCKEWDSLEAVTAVRGVRQMTASEAVAGPLQDATENTASAVRHSFGFSELDRVFGGGLVSGSVTLLGGEPGIGKSTLLLQVAAALSNQQKTLYASGEESTAQISLRARRLQLNAPQLALLSEHSLDAILGLAAARKPDLLIVDSIQTMQLAANEASAGSPAQLRECAALLVRFAKANACAVIIVGHVTKDGSIAGPKLLEHLVDTVLYFESDAGSRYRMLRATKNRFGPVNELGFFAMSDAGLKEVRNPSAIFLSRHPEPVPGSVVMVARDGGRPMLVEVQALVSRAGFGAPRRVAQGVDSNRVSMLLAILSRHADLALADYDVFVNLVGGLDIAETATDLPLALALASSLKDQPVRESLAAFGELGLTGEVRPVAYGDERVREAVKLGFSRVMLPRENLPRTPPEAVSLQPVSRIADALSLAFA
ncbi:MAG TPA: DNA repair protein RadA [Steroidobacteraceae bacterium]|nr:DNA repair protein RadA [Steroidobacteraceae bacterium]